MKNKFIIIISSLAFLFSCSDENKVDIIGSGNIIEDTRMLSSFNSVTIDGIIDISITQGQSPSVIVKADDNVIDQIITEVTNDNLNIELVSGNYNNVSLEVQLVMPQIVMLNRAGTGQASLDNFNNISTLEIIKSGTGNIMMSGIGQNLDIEKDGTGSINGFGFEVDACDISSSGTGDIEITCLTSLTGSLNGTGDLLYKGSPSLILVEENGTGEVIDAN